MIDWGAYVIVASIIWSDGETSDYHPSTRFDQVSCLKTAMRINAEWRANGIIGFATCNLADPDGGPKASSGENYRTNPRVVTIVTQAIIDRGAGKPRDHSNEQTQRVDTSVLTPEKREALAALLREAMGL
jgi:hypothetical protein